MRLMTKDRFFYRNFFSLTFAIAIQNLIVFSVGLADNIMLGAYSETALSGVALANQIQYLLQMLITGCAESVVVVASQYWGKKDLAPIKHLIAAGLFFSLCSALLLFCIVFTAPDWCLGLLTNDAAVIAEGVSYLRVICFSYFFFAITTTIVTSLRSVETVNIGYVVPLSTLVINASLNYVLIYGNFGAPRLGAQGAAIATLTARVIELVIVTVYLAFFEKKLHLKLSDLVRQHSRLFRDFVRVAMPVIASNAMWGLAMFIQAGILGHLGAAAIAANSISITLLQILSVFSYATASAASIIIGKCVGEGRIDRVKEYSYTMQILFLIIGAITGLTLFLSKNFILQFYAIAPETKAMAAQFINVLSVTIFGTSYEVGCLVGIVRGGGDTKFVLFNDMIFMWGIVLPLSALTAFVFKLPPVFVFICLKSDQILKCFVSVVKVNRFRWVRRLTRDAI